MSHAPNDHSPLPLISIRQVMAMLLLEGFVSVAIQFLVLRQLIPFVGSSIIVTSLVISVFLAFLALGYRQGGSIEKNQIKVLQSNLLISSLLLGLGVSYVAVAIFFDGFYKIAMNPLWPLLIYLAIVLAPLVYLLGQTLPLLINFMGQHRAAKQAGDALAFSTYGNVVGGICTTVILMYYLGMAWSLFIHATLLALLALWLQFLLYKKQRVWSSMVVAGVIAIHAVVNIGLEKNIFITTNAYANYEVVVDPDDKHGMHFLINRGDSSFLDKDKKAHLYAENVKALLFELLKLEDKDILILGAGGFSITAEGTFNNRVTYVDIDPKIKDIAEQHFLKESIKGAFIADDARGYLRKHDKKQWDVIIADAYSNWYTIPWHLATKEFFTLMRDRLHNGGVAVINVIMDPFLQDRYSKTIDNTVRSVFSSCFTQISGYRSNADIANVVYFCRKHPEEAWRGVYKDDTNRVTMDMFQNLYRKR